MRKKYAIRHNKGGLLLMVVVVLVILITGALFFKLIATQADRDMRGNMLQQISFLAHAINTEQIKALSGTAADLEKTEYLALKEQLSSIRSDNKQYRFIYIIGRNDNGTFFFYVDSEPADSKDYSPPGQTYKEAIGSFSRVFDTKNGEVEGPATDRWGTWVSASVPLIDPKTGGIIALLCMDISADTWDLNVLGKSALPIGLTLIILIGIATAYISSFRVSDSPKPIMRHLMLPLIVIVVIAIIGGGLLLYKQHQLYLAKQSGEYDISFNLQAALKQQASAISMAMQPIVLDKKIKDALREGDVSRLQSDWESVFESIKLENNVTHFSFFNKNRICILRLHKPDKSGDLIERFIILEAERTGKTASGIDIGPLGTIALRVVKPVFDGSELVGYVELAKEIEDVIQSLHRKYDVQLDVVIHKDSINRQIWENGMRMLGRKADWNQLTNNALIYASQGQLPDDLLSLADQTAPIHTSIEKSLKLNNKDCLASFAALKGGDGREIGYILSIRDISAEKAYFFNWLMLCGISAVVLLSIVLGFVYILIKRTDAGICRQQMALIERERSYYNQFANNSAAMLLIGTKDGSIIDANAVAVNFYGYTRERLLSMHISDINTTSSAKILEEMASAHDGHGGMFTFQHRLADGDLRDVEVSASIVQFGGNKVIHLIIYDITERKRAEEELRAASLYSRNLIETSIDPLLTISAEGKITDLNASAEKITGVSRERLIGSDFSDYFTDPEMAHYGYQKAFTEGRIVDYPLAIRHTSGNIIEVLYNASVYKNEQGTILGVLAIARDITEHKRVEEALRTSEEHYRTLFSSMHDGFAVHEIICDNDGNAVDYRFLAVNKAFERITGLKVKEVEGRTVLEVLPRTEPFWIRTYGNVALTGEPATLENYSIELNRYFEVSAFRPASNQFACIISDITERKQLEEYRNMGRELLEILNEAGDLHDLIQRILSVLKTKTGLDAVGIRLQKDDDFPYFAQQGFSKDFILKENMLAGHDKDGGICRDKDGNIKLECTCGLVISGKTDPLNQLFTKGGSCWTNNSLPLLDISADQDPRFHPRNTCIHEKYASIALVPIKNKHRIVGLLHLNDRRKGCFTLTMVELLEEIASHIGEAMLRIQAEDALRKSEQSYRNQFANNSAAMLLIDPKDGSIIDANAGAVNFYGYPLEHLLTMRISDINIMHASEIMRSMESVISGQGKMFIFRHRLADGSLRDVEVSSSNIWFGGKAVLHSIIYDITERKRAEEEIRRHAGLISSLLDSIPDIIFFKDMNGHYLGCNPAFLEFVGRSRDEIIGKTDYDIFGKEIADSFRVKDKLMLAFGKSRHNEEWITYPDGRKKLLDTLKTPYWGLNGTLIGLIGISRDITERNNAEDALRKSEERYRRLFDYAPDGIIITDANGCCIDANDSMCRMMDYTRKELIGMRVSDIIIQEEVKNIEEASVEMKYRSNRDKEKLFKCKDGSVFTGEIIETMMPDGNRMAMIRDISEQKRREQELNRFKNQLFQAEKMASLGVLVSGVAHEINNPVNFIMLNTPILKDIWDSSSPVIDEYAKKNNDFMLGGLPYAEMKEFVPSLLQGLYEGAGRIKNIVSGLKNYGRQDCSDYENSVDVNGVVLAALTLLSSVVKQATRNLHVTYDKSLPMIKGNSQKLEQVVINVIQNACQSLRSMDKNLEISTFLDEDGRVCIRIADEGTGISEENLLKVTDPFFTTKRDSGGTGLGLSISAGIIKDMNGILNIESKVGVGTTVTISLCVYEEKS